MADCQINQSRRAKTVGATVEKQPGNINKWKKVLLVTYFQSHTKSDGSGRRSYSVGSEPTCTLEETEANEESIKIADVNGSTDKTSVDVNENTIEVTVHVSPQGENTLTIDQKSESTSL